MNNSLLKRFEPALGLLAEALKEPADFIKVNLSFGHGGRQLPGQAEAADAAASQFRYRLPGHSGTAAATDLINLIRECAGLYDTCRIELLQRGQSRYFEVNGKGVRMGNLPSKGVVSDKLATDHVFEGVSATREYRVPINEASELLQAIGIIDQQGRLRNDKIRKYNQIDRFVELADPLLRELATDRTSLAVYDLACGKSYLSFVLNHYIRETMHLPCRITGIDLSPGVITSSQKLADRLGYRNMTFRQGDLRDLQVNEPVDLCISLHACDVATDYALAAGVAVKSRAIIAVPCCQRELLASGYQLPEPLDGIADHGVLKARMADLITDHLRLLLLKAAGYQTSLIEYITPLDTPKNLMLRAVWTGKRDEASIMEYKNLTELLGKTITFGKIMEETDYGRHSGYSQS